MINSRYLVFILFIFIFISQFVFGQQASINALKVSQSKVIEELKSVKAGNPAISAEEFANTANSLLDKEGFNYAFIFDENTCRAIGEARKKQKDPDASLNLNAKLSSVAGDKTSLILPKEQYDASECGRCFVYLPVW